MAGEIRAEAAVELAADVRAAVTGGTRFDWKKWLFRAAAVLLPAAGGVVCGWLGKPDPQAVREAAAAGPAVPPQCELVTDYEGAAFDGHAEKLHAAPFAAKRWPTDVIPYWVDYQSAAAVRPAVSTDVIRAGFRQAADWWCEGLQISMPEVSDPGQALLRMRFVKIDGPMNVLARQYLPDGSRTPRDMEVDVQERWTWSGPAAGSINAPTVVAHELGHALGLEHSPAGSGHLMAPTYTSAVPKPTAADYARMVAELGYRPRAVSTPGPGDYLNFPVQAKVGDVIEALKRSGYTVGR